MYERKGVLFFIYAACVYHYDKRKFVGEKGVLECAHIFNTFDTLIVLSLITGHDLGLPCRSRVKIA